MTAMGPENKTLAECALAAQRLFEAQQWVWSRRIGSGEYDVPDAERILQTLSRHLGNVRAEVVNGASDGATSGNGRLKVEACGDDCARTCETRCVQVYFQLGELEVDW